TPPSRSSFLLTSIQASFKWGATSCRKYVSFSAFTLAPRSVSLVRGTSSLSRRLLSGLEAHDFSLVLERAVHGVGLGLEHVLDDELGVGVGPGDGGQELLFLCRPERQARVLEGVLQDALE